MQSIVLEGKNDEWRVEKFDPFWERKKIKNGM
jgi:hypothetical protein